MEDHGLVKEVTSASEDNTVHPIHCCRYFITDKIIDLMVRETNRYAEQFFRAHKITSRSKFCQWKPTTDQEILKFLGIIIQMGLVQMPKLSHYWSSSQLYGSEIIQNSMPREREVRIVPQILAFSEQRQQECESGQAVQVETALGFTESQIFVSVYTWFGCHYR